jgi:hypothetical protein
LFQRGDVASGVPAAYFGGTRVFGQLDAVAQVPVGAEPDRLQLGKPLAAAGAAEENRELVADQFAAAAGEDTRQAGQARPMLLADAGREPSQTAAVRGHGPADRCAGGGDRVAGAMIQRNWATQDARAGEVFAESIEKMGYAILDFARSAGAPSFGVESGSRKKNAARRNKGWRLGLY